MSIVPTIDWLVVSGRAAVEAYRRLNGIERQAGDHELVVVTREGFIRHPEICLDYAIQRRPVQVLNRDGSFAALLCRHTIP